MIPQEVNVSENADAFPLTEQVCNATTERSLC